MTAPLSLSLRDTTPEELDAIVEMEQGDASRFVLPASREQHEQDLTAASLIYKSVIVEGDLVGFVILGIDADGLSLELRRIVVARTGHGYGRQALRLVDDVAQELGRDRIWLDVFEDNARARYVYDTCGYSVFGDTELHGRRLLLYERLLAPTSP